MSNPKSLPSVKRDVHQSVFDSPEAKKLIKQAFKEVDRELDAQFRAGGPFAEGDPNHPKFNQSSSNPETIFGYETKAFMARQYKTAKEKPKSPGL